MAADNIDHANLVGVSFQGLVAEDVDMARIWDISWIPLVFSDMIGSNNSHDNEYFSWTQDKLQDVDPDNAYVDGADLTQDDTNLGARVGNHSQTLTKRVSVSHRARAAGTIAFADALAHQVMYRQQEIRRDLEAIITGRQASVADDGVSTPGRLGAFGAWLTTNTSRGATGSDGGFSGGTVAAPTAGNKRALTETLIRDMAESVYEQGGNVSVLTSYHRVIRRLSEYLFTDVARIATLQRNEQGRGAAFGVGTINAMITDYDVTIEFRPNRLQQLYTAADTGNVADVYLVDPAMATISTLYDWRLEEQGKTGLATPMQIAGDKSLKVGNEAAHAVIADIDPTLAVTA